MPLIGGYELMGVPELQALFSELTNMHVYHQRFAEEVPFVYYIIYACKPEGSLFVSIVLFLQPWWSV